MPEALDHAYMTIDDLPSMVADVADRTARDPAGRRRIADAGARLSADLTGAVRAAFPDTRSIDPHEIDRALGETLAELLARHPAAAVLSFDKQLPRALPADGEVLRLRMTRSADGTRLPRQGAGAGIAEQLSAIEAAVGGRPLIVVDDCWSTGGTMRFFLDQRRDDGGSWRDRVAAIVTAQGPDVTSFEGIPLHIAFRFRKLFDGVMLSDLTPFGGRTLSVSPDGSTAVASPYVPPFADGRFWGLHSVETPAYFAAAGRILGAQEEFFREVDAASGRALTFGEWNALQYPTAFSPDAVPQTPAADVPVLRGISEARRALGRHAALVGGVRNAVTDFDNTLYSYAGSQHYAGSVLAARHDEQVRQLVRHRRAGAEADLLIERALADPNTSLVLARELDMTRERCLELVWKDIDPAECCVEHPENVSLLERARSALPGTFTLLTGAPPVWVRNVARHLRLPLGVFDRIITTEQYGHKREVFRSLRDSDEGPTVSMGDDPATDVLPAAEAGMHGIVVKNSVRSLHYAGRLFPERP